MVKAKESKRNIKNVGKRIGKYLKACPEHKRLKTVIVSDIMVKRYGFSLRGTMSELRYGRDSRRTAGPQHVPPKSLPRKWPKRAPVDLPGGLIPFAAGKAAYGPFSADSTRRRFNRYVLAKHVKGGGWPTRASATSWPLRTAGRQPGGDRRGLRRRRPVWEDLLQDVRRKMRRLGGQRLPLPNKLRGGRGQGQ